MEGFMNYTDVKKLDTVLTENEYVENRIGRGDAARSEEIGEELGPRTQKRRLPPKKAGERRPSLIKSLKNKIDIYDALMIPVGAGIIVAFIMLALKLI
jgi:hypothetical protein